MPSLSEMGSGLLAYSGIATKLRAMEARLLTEEDYRKILSLPDVPAVAAFLRGHPGYQEAFASCTAEDTHREMLEQIIRKSIDLDYRRIYRFADAEQKAFLAAYRGDADAPLFDEGKGGIIRFGELWRKRKEIAGDREGAEILTRILGTRFDLLNLWYIHRAKKYYHLSGPDLYAVTIPYLYRLKKQDVDELAKASDEAEFGRVLRGTWYGKKYPSLTPDKLRELCDDIVYLTIRSEMVRHPASFAVFFGYLYQKEFEAYRLTTAIECVRYGVAPQEALTIVKGIPLRKEARRL